MIEKFCKMKYKIRNLIKKKLSQNKTYVNFRKKQLMKGKIPSNIISREKLHETLEKSQHFEKYHDYVERSQYIYEQIKNLEKIEKSHPILEIGCGSGRNLNWLYQKGFTNLSGIEISPNAITMMKKHFPKIFSQSKILIGPAEEKIKEFDENHISITFTMSALQLIHPSSNFLFNEISRITKNYIITVERENLFNPQKEFPRDYKVVFENLGWHQIKSKEMTESMMGKSGYILRIFKMN
jgi:SAM-dependent methyltransferase